MSTPLPTPTCPACGSIDCRRSRWRCLNSVRDIRRMTRIIGMRVEKFDGALRVVEGNDDNVIQRVLRCTARDRR